MAKRISIVIVVLLLIFGGIFGFKFLQIRQMMSQMSQPRPPATVASSEVRIEQWQPTLQAIGSLVAVNGIEVSSEVDGVISEIHFESGQQVQRGDPLVRLDDNVDRAALEALRAAARLAEVQFKRATELLPKKAVSKSSYDESKAAYEAALALVHEQQARVARKTIRAPFSGLVGLRLADLGQFLKAGAAIVRLESLDPLYVDYSLPERYLPRLALDQQVRIRVDALPDETFTGTLTAMDAGIDEGTRSIKLRATISNTDGRLRPGMFAEVETLQGETTEVLTVPRTAISFNTYGNFAFVIEQQDGKQVVKRRQLTTGDIREGRVVIREGLQAGEQVVRAGLVKLRDGQAVQIDNSVELKDAEVSHE
jgi:membrane fusion protein (multidrug efflux system)